MLSSKGTQGKPAQRQTALSLVVIMPDKHSYAQKGNSKFNCYNQYIMHNKKVYASRPYIESIQRGYHKKAGLQTFLHSQAPSRVNTQWR